MSQGERPDRPSRLAEAQRYWDRAAATFDDEPDHGLHPGRVQRAWTHLLDNWLPGPEGRILDAGCGTGSLSVVMARLELDVVGIDVSPTMIERARAKTAGLGPSVEFHVMDAARPQLPRATFNAILGRHVLWVLPEPAEVLRRWARLLAPGGRLMLIEGDWDSGGGFTTDEVVAVLPPSFTIQSILDLSSDPDYWGKPVTDERYAVIADRRT